MAISSDAILLKDSEVGWDEVINLKNSETIKQIEQIQIVYLNTELYTVSDILSSHMCTNVVQLTYSKLRSRAGGCTAVNLVSGVTLRLFEESEYDIDNRMTNVILREKYLYYAVYNYKDKIVDRLII